MAYLAKSRFATITFIGSLARKKESPTTIMRVVPRPVTTPANGGLFHGDRQRIAARFDLGYLTRWRSLRWRRARFTFGASALFSGG